MKVWLVIVGVGAVSLLLRASSLVLLRGRTLPPGLLGSLGLVPAAVLSALVVPELLVHGGDFRPLGPRLVAGAAAGLIAWKTRNVLWTLLGGLGLLFGFEALGWR